MSDYEIGHGQVLYRPHPVREPDISRRRRRRLRGKRKAGLLPTWQFKPLGHVQPFTLQTTLQRKS